MLFHIEVRVNETSSAAHRSIRDCVHSGIKTACTTLKYHVVQFEDAFMCAGPSCTLDPRHVAIVVRKGQSYKWKCTIVRYQNGDLSEDQLMWLGDSAVNTLGGW